MPGGDGTGPRGLGPGTGRGFGPCGQGRGYGRGFGRGMGRDPGRGFRRRFYFPIDYDLTKEEEKEMLEQEVKNLEGTLNGVRKRLDELG